MASHLWVFVLPVFLALMTKTVDLGFVGEPKRVNTKVQLQYRQRRREGPPWEAYQARNVFRRGSGGWWWA